MMRSFNLVRSVCCTGLALGLLVGVAATSAQDVTQEPTEDMMMTQMMSMQGACPQDAAATMLMNMTGMSGTPMMGATEDTNMMMTPAATMDMMATPMIGATEDMNMTGTEEAMGVKCLFGTFSGAAEVPGPGDTDGMGAVFVSVDATNNEICYEEAVWGITLPAAATHIHVNSAGVSGDVVVPFPVAPDADGMASGCTTTTVEGLAQAIASTPEQYYVNVHTSDFPGGAVRAQLSAWDSSIMNDMGMKTTPSADMGTGMESSSPMATAEATMGS
ncbi:MAG: CHRD domain-containing protein [Chloroflexota bacterium]